MNEFEIDVSDNGKTVWINGSDGSCLARFDKRFGLDVHRSATEQMKGAPQCLYCTHEKPNQEDWIMFCEKVKLNHGIDVPINTLVFEGA